MKEQEELELALVELKQAHGEQEKLEAAARVLAVAGLIANTPAGRHCWVEDL